ncbi:MAG: hypothetical protein IJB32_04725 [Clostridia bacterium]|nr:hypothetical protein [Clostridia bacterium]
MKFKKVLAILLALCTCVSVMFTGCSAGGSNSGGDIEINIANIGGGVGRKWLDEAIVRYNQKRVEDGEEKVTFDITHQQSIGTATMNTDDYNVYFIEGAMTKTTIASGMAMDITDVVTSKNSDGKTIDSKIDSNIKEMLTDNNSNYYALPHYEYYPGFSYNIDLFDANKLYFAQEQSGATEVETDFGTGYFINDENTTKSLGNDGLPNTPDDGLPTTLVELLQLCQYMYRDCSIIPFVLTGEYPFYANKMILALWTSLAGESRMKGCYDLECDDVNVVEGFSETPLFAGYDYAKTPILSENRVVTQDDGYRMHQQVERYYATLFMEIAKKSGWISEGNNGSATHTGAQKDFMFGGRTVGGTEQLKYGMLIEETYWYNEAEDAGTVDDFSQLFPGEAVNVGWMSLPTSFDIPVTCEADARNVVFLDTAASYTFINGNIASDTELTNACKDFVKFLYSDEELSNFTKCTGVGRSLNYELLNDKDGAPLAAQLPKFKQDIWDLRNSGAIIYLGSNSEIFQKNAGSFRLSTTCDVLSYNDYKGYYQATGVNNSVTAEDYFKGTGVSQTLYAEFLANI